MLTGAQMRAARGLLNVSVAELAADTGLAINTVRRAEAVNGEIPITSANAQAIQNWFESRGVMFIDADDLGPGVRLRVAEPLPTARRRRPKSSLEN